MTRTVHAVWAAPTAAGRAVSAAGVGRRLGATVVPYGVAADLAEGGRLMFAGPPLNIGETTDLVLDHDTDAVVGRSVEYRDAGDRLYGRWQVFRHATGDQVLTDAAAGRRDGVSVHAVVYAEHAAADGTAVADEWRLRNVALVDTPAFGTRIREIAAASATGGTMPKQPEPEREQPERDEPEPEQPEQPEPEQPEPDAGDDEQPAKDALGRDVQAARPARVPAAPRRRTGGRPSVGLAAAAAQVAAAVQRGAMQGGMGREVMAALADITPAGNGAGNEQAGLATGYLGELWSGVSYERVVVPQVSTQQLTGTTYTGWTWAPPPTGSAYTGNKSAVPSNAAKLKLVTGAPVRWAGAHDLDRIYADLGAADVLQSYWQRMADSYARSSDGYLATALVAGATAATGTFTDLATALLTMSIQVSAVGQPSFALCSPELVLQSLTVKAADAPVGMSGLGIVNVTLPPVIPTDLIPTGTVLVGTRSAATFLELSPPVRVEAVNVPNGGVDPGLFGYYGHLISDARGLVKTTITTTP